MFLQLTSMKQAWTPSCTKWFVVPMLEEEATDTKYQGSTSGIPFRPFTVTLRASTMSLLRPTKRRQYLSQSDPKRAEQEEFIERPLTAAGKGKHAKKTAQPSREKEKTSGKTKKDGKGNKRKADNEGQQQQAKKQKHKKSKDDKTPYMTKKRQDQQKN